MFHKKDDPIRQMLVDKIESTAVEYNSAVYSLKTYDNNKKDLEEQDEEPSDRRANFI